MTYDVVLDYPINQKQLPMYKKKRRLPKILSEQELSIFFNVCENYMYKVEDIDSKNMRLFVTNGKGEKERYTVLPKASLEMLRKYYRIYKPNHSELFLNVEGNPLKVERLRGYFIRYRRKGE